jgi:hypothetical protein
MVEVMTKPEATAESLPPTVPVTAARVKVTGNRNDRNNKGQQK